MPIRKLPITLGANRNTEEVGMRTHGATMINFFVDSNGNLVRWPGLVDFCDFGTSKGVDGIAWWPRQSIAIGVSNGSIFKITDRHGSFTDITGSSMNVGQPVSFAPWDTSVFAANGGRIMEIPASGTTSFIADADAPTTVDFVGEIDKYLVANEDNTERIWFADVTAPLSWSAQFVSAVSKFDLLRTVKIANHEMELFGDTTKEIWNTTGNSDIPFAKQLQRDLEIGIGAVQSAALCDRQWFWLDDSYRVVRGQDGVEFSRTLSAYLQTMGTKSDAIGGCVTFSGETFYIISFPMAEKTIACNVRGGWNEIAYWKDSQSLYEHYLSKSMCYAKAWNKMLVGDRKTGKVYTLTPHTHQDSGGLQRSLLRTIRIDHGTLHRKQTSSLRVNLVRLDTPTDYTDVTMSIRWRDDDNTTWKSWRDLTIGSSGKTGLSKRIGAGLGMYRNRQYEIVMHSNHPVAIESVEEEFNYA
jgi:hypothetical protein